MTKDQQIPDRRDSVGAGGADQRWYALPSDEIAATAGRRPRPRACPPLRRRRGWRRMGRTRWPRRRPRRGGSGSWRSTSPTCRSSWSGRRSPRSLIGEISTGLAVLLITALNALGGLRQQGKAESAMNALQSMLKTSARVRRDGTEVKVDADQVVVGDVVLLAAGRRRVRRRADHRGDVAADRRVGVDRGERAGVQGHRRGHRREPGPGRPVEHGVHEHPGDPRQRGDDRDRHRLEHRGGHDLRDVEVDADAEDAD